MRDLQDDRVVLSRLWRYKSIARSSSWAHTSGFRLQLSVSYRCVRAGLVLSGGIDDTDLQETCHVDPAEVPDLGRDRDRSRRDIVHRSKEYTGMAILYSGTIAK